MTHTLPCLRRHLDAMPSPVEDQPGLLLRDPFQYSDTLIIVPPPLVPFLQLFDGTRSDLDLKESLVRASGDLRAAAIGDQLALALSEAGFLEDAAFERLRDTGRRAFAAAPVREATHAGNGGYPAEAEALRVTLDRYLDGFATVASASHVAAPHVSLEGGVRCYGAAYHALRAPEPGTTFVILGTSHYGAPERFGLTRKPFRTPLGEARVATHLVDALERTGGGAVVREDYCHRVEHSIEFQVVFLQHRFGPDVSILPILCGPFASSTSGAGLPEADPGVARFLDALAELAAREGRHLRCVLGVDMSHIGRRYGDPAPVRAGEGALVEVAAQDRRRIERIVAGDAGGFWELVQEQHDASWGREGAREDNLRWCGASPFYTFLRTLAPGPGTVLEYEQWNIDAQSVVSFAGLAFGPRCEEA